MGKGAFKLYLKKDGARPTTGDSPLEVDAASAASGKKDAAPEKPIPAVYDDVSVCKLLRIHRRVIAAARTKSSRGRDWDCVGLHAGMTKEWIEQEALKRGIVPDFINNPLKPIGTDDKVVSCKIMGTWPNKQRVTVEVVANGQIKIATVRDADEFHLYDIFDAQDYGNELSWTPALNDARY